MECTEVDEGVGRQVEVGDERGDGVELSDEEKANGHEEGEDVAAVRLPCFAVALREEQEARVDAIDAQGLDEPGHGQQVGQRRAQSRGEAARVDDVRRRGDELHGGVAVRQTVRAIYFTCNHTQN